MVHTRNFTVFLGKYTVNTAGDEDYKAGEIKVRRVYF